MTNLSKLIILSLCVFSTIGLQGQIPKTFCGLDELLRKKSIENDSGIEKEKKDIGKDFINKRGGSVVYINTVVHVFHDTDEPEISDSLIIELVEDVNKVFRMEIDTSLIIPELRPFAADSRIQLCLAKYDPDGNPTNGINRKKVLVNSFPYENEIESEPVKTDSLGGISPWNTDEYLNIWIGEIDDEQSYINYGVPQRMYWPLSEEVDYGIPGIVIDRGTVLTNIPFFTPSGILAHELGHALGLKHTHGDPPGLDLICDFDDKIDDTPLCGFLFDVCNADGINSCEEGENDLMDNISNIMGYSCSVMITKMQGAQMYENVTEFGPKGFILTASELESSVNTDEDELNNLQFNIFPNPSSGIFEVSIECPFYPAMELTLFDVNGIKLKKKIISSKSMLNVYWDLNYLPAGIYFLTLNANGNFSSKKVIISN